MKQILIRPSKRWHHKPPPSYPAKNFIHPPSLKNSTALPYSVRLTTAISRPYSQNSKSQLTLSLTNNTLSSQRATPQYTFRSLSTEMLKNNRVKPECSNIFNGLAPSRKTRFFRAEKPLGYFFNHTCVENGGNPGPQDLKQSGSADRSTQAECRMQNSFVSPYFSIPPNVVTVYDAHLKLEEMREVKVWKHRLALISECLKDVPKNQKRESVQTNHVEVDNPNFEMEAHELMYAPPFFLENHPNFNWNEDEQLELGARFAKTLFLQDEKRFHNVIFQIQDNTEELYQEAPNFPQRHNFVSDFKLSFKSPTVTFFFRPQTGEFWRASPGYRLFFLLLLLCGIAGATNEDYLQACQPTLEDRSKGHLISQLSLRFYAKWLVFFLTWPYAPTEIPQWVTDLLHSETDEFVLEILFELTRSATRQQIDQIFDPDLVANLLAIALSPDRNYTRMLYALTVLGFISETCNPSFFSLLLIPQKILDDFEDIPYILFNIITRLPPDYVAFPSAGFFKPLYNQGLGNDFFSKYLQIFANLSDSDFGQFEMVKDVDFYGIYFKSLLEDHPIRHMQKHYTSTILANLAKAVQNPDNADEISHVPQVDLDLLTSFQPQHPLLTLQEKETLLQFGAISILAPLLALTLNSTKIWEVHRSSMTLSALREWTLTKGNSAPRFDLRSRILETQTFRKFGKTTLIFSALSAVLMGAPYLPESEERGEFWLRKNIPLLASLAALAVYPKSFVMLAAYSLASELNPCRPAVPSPLDLSKK